MNGYIYWIPVKVFERFTKLLWIVGPLLALFQVGEHLLELVNLVFLGVLFVTLALLSYDGFSKRRYHVELLDQAVNIACCSEVS